MVVNVERASVFYHNGHDNIVTNNILINATNSAEKDAQVEIVGQSNYSRNNEFEQNVVIWGETPTMALFGGNVGSAGTDDAYLRRSQNNCFIFLCNSSGYPDSACGDFYSNTELTPLGWCTKISHQMPDRVKSRHTTAPSHTHT